MVAQLVNELRPERVPHPQIKLDMPDCYEGDPAEIDNVLSQSHSTAWKETMRYMIKKC